MNTIDRFFIDTNKVTIPVSDEEYQKAKHLTAALEAIARTTYQSLYVIDYYNHNFLYVSENPIFLCGHTPSEVQEMGYGFYMQHVPEHELGMLLEINRAGFEFCSRLTAEEKVMHTISYDFHIREGRHDILINHKMTPLVLSSDGSIWLAVCVVSLSPNREHGHIVMRKTGSAEHWLYSLQRHRWEQASNSKISEREKDILLLSARGYTMNDIADRLCMSVDTVKFHKRALFERLNVNNITSALSVASSYKML